MAKSYTCRGDDGTTSKIGGNRFSKADPVPRALGALDEANSAIGVVRSLRENIEEPSKWCEDIQHLIFRIGADIATSDGVEPTYPRIVQDDTKELERLTDALDKEMPELKLFILPSGTQGAALLHLARAIIRRAERDIIAAKNAGEALNEAIFPCINRLSSYMFALARWINLQAGVEETHPEYLP